MPVGADLKVLVVPVVLVAVQTSMAVHSMAVLAVVVQAVECSRKENEVASFKTIVSLTPCLREAYFKQI